MSTPARRIAVVMSSKSMALRVEFTDADGVTQALVTIAGEDLEVVWRPKAGGTPA
jgi:hypothetical protein